MRIVHGEMEKQPVVERDAVLTDDDLRYRNVEKGDFSKCSLVSKSERRRLTFLIYVPAIFFLVNAGFAIAWSLLFSHGWLAGFGVVLFLIVLLFLPLILIIPDREYLKKCVSILDADFFRYRDRMYMKQWKGPVTLQIPIATWQEEFAKRKEFVDSVLKKRKRWSYMLLRGVVWNFDYTFLFCFGEIPSKETLIHIADRERVNIILCFREIGRQSDQNAAIEECLMEYQINEVDGIRFRIAYIGLDLEANAIINRPRVVLMLTDEAFVRSYHLPLSESVVIDYSVEMYEFIMKFCFNYVEKSN